MSNKIKPLTMSLEEVFEIAINIEKNGALFYEQAAKKCKEHRTFLADMAEQEKGHGALFSVMRDKFVAKENQFLDDPNTEEVLKYIKVLSDSRVFLEGEHSGELFSSYSNANAVFDEAIRREGNAIIFFLALKKLIRDENDLQAIDELINEELTHIVWINKHREEE